MFVDRCQGENLFLEEILCSRGPHWERLVYKAQFCLSILTPLKLLEVQASNLARLIIL